MHMCRISLDHCELSKSTSFHSHCTSAQQATAQPDVHHVLASLQHMLRHAMLAATQGRARCDIHRLTSQLTLVSADTLIETAALVQLRNAIIEEKEPQYSETRRCAHRLTDLIMVLRRFLRPGLPPGDAWPPCSRVQMETILSTGYQAGCSRGHATPSSPADVRRARQQTAGEANIPPAPMEAVPLRPLGGARRRPGGGGACFRSQQTRRRRRRHRQCQIHQRYCHRCCRRRRPCCRRRLSPQSGSGDPCRRRQTACPAVTGPPVHMRCTRSVSMRSGVYLSALCRLFTQS